MYVVSCNVKMYCTLETDITHARILHVQYLRLPLPARPIIHDSHMLKIRIDIQLQLTNCAERRIVLL